MSKHYLRESSSAESENNMVPKLRIQFDSEIKPRTIKSEVANGTLQTRKAFPHVLFVM